MSKIAEIEAVLPDLTAEELGRVERAIHSQFRQRGQGIVYDDTHGVETEADLVAAADAAFQSCDQAEAQHAKRPARWSVAGGFGDDGQGETRCHL